MRRRGRPEYAVIGLGRFGSSVALMLARQGYSVLGIDESMDVVQRLSDELTHVVALDATNEDALRDVDIGAFDTVVVSMGEHFEASLLITASLKELGVANVIAKAASERQREILLKIGADRVVLPEIEAGQRLAIEMTTPGSLAALAFGANHTVVEVEIPAAMDGQTLAEADLRRRFGVVVLAVGRGNDAVVAPPADFRFALGDRLVVLGANDALTRLSSIE